MKGSDVFNGKIIHSHNYRDADPFKGNSVLVVGCGASGLDISYGVSKVAEKVNFNTRHFKCSFLTSNHHNLGFLKSS